MSSSKNCCMLKMCLAIASFALVGYFSGYLWHVFESAWNTEALKPIWRPMDAQHWKYMPLANIIQAIIFVCIYCCYGMKAMCCPCPMTRGAKFGFKIWLIASFSGSIFWFISENVTMDVVVLAMAQQFITFVVGGAIVGKIKGNPVCDASAPAGACSTGKNKCS